MILLLPIFQSACPLSCCRRSQMSRRSMPAPAAAGVGSTSMKKNGADPIPVMDYRQYRRARRLVHECCNYDGGHCIALDDGEECVCVQSISYSLLCRWFRAAVLPLDRELETALFHRMDAKKCAVCGAPARCCSCKKCRCPALPQAPASG